jgi:hypothetical protein
MPSKELRPSRTGRGAQLSSSNWYRTDRWVGRNWHFGDIEVAPFNFRFIALFGHQPIARSCLLLTRSRYGAAEHWIKEGKNAIKWTRLSCCSFAANAVRLQLHALAYNLADFMRTLALSEAVKQWSLTSLREKLVKIGAKVVHHGRYVIFQLAEVAVPKELFQEILRLIDGLRPRPVPA